MHCADYIIMLVVGNILAQLKSGTYKQVAKLVTTANTNRSVFAPNECSALSVYQKVRAFVLWIQDSDERRAEWRKFCTVFIPLDIDTRWNALYLMMLKAWDNKGAITRFARQHPEVRHLVP